jgi:hypothetical protein
VIARGAFPFQRATPFPSFSGCGAMFALLTLKVSSSNSADDVGPMRGVTISRLAANL